MSFDDMELKKVIVWAATWKDPVEIVDSKGDVHRGLIRSFGPKITRLQVSETGFKSISTDSIISVKNLREEGSKEFFPQWEE